MHQKLVDRVDEALFEIYSVVDPVLKDKDIGKGDVEALRAIAQSLSSLGRDLEAFSDYLEREINEQQ